MAGIDSRFATLEALWVAPVANHVRVHPHFPDPDELERWGCSACGGRFPAACAAHVTVVGDRFMLCFCSLECTEDAGYHTAARHFRERYALIGDPWIIVTDDQRIPDPALPRDRERYPDVLLVSAEARARRPSWAALEEIAREAAEREADIFLRAGED